TETVIRDVLRLDDAEGVDCLPNKEIFAGLARIGYEKPSTKLTFYKAFFSSQWKFIQLIIQNQLGDLSTHTTQYISPALTQKVFANMRRVEKGFSGVETPLFEGMLLAREIEEQGDVDEQTRVKKLERANKVKTLKLRRLRKVGTSQRIKSSTDTDIEDASNQGRMIAEDLGEESTTKTPAKTKSKDKGKEIKVEEPKYMKKKQHVEMDEEYARKLHEELNQDIDWDVVIDHFNSNIEFLLKSKEQIKEEENRALENGQDQVWKSQRSVHGQAKVKSWKLLGSCGVHIISFTTTRLILLVERRYPLSRFTLDQMLNPVRLQVEEQSEMSLELLSFGVDAAIELEEKHQVFNAAGEELSAAKHKLMLLDTAAERRLMLLSQVKTVNEKCCC
nr:hypothetical protein [Tanacetum cinerariifolium]